MRTGRLSISRGNQLAEKRAEPAVVKPVSFSPAADKSDLQLIHVRLNALERLTRLVEQGTLSMEEFQIEKSLVLRMTSGETPPVKAPQPERGPALLSRVTGWRFLIVAVAAGIGLSFAAQPDATVAFFSDAADFVTG